MRDVAKGEKATGGHGSRLAKVEWHLHTGHEVWVVARVNVVLAPEHIVMRCAIIVFGDAVNVTALWRATQHSA